MEHTNTRRPFAEIVRTIATALDARYVNFLEASSVAPGPAVTSNRFLIDTGLHACTEWRHGDNVRLVMIADNNIDTFWAVVKERLQLNEDFKAPKSHVLELSDPALARGGNVHPAVNEIIQLCKKSDCKFYLHYYKARDGNEISQLKAEANGPIKHDFLFGNVAHDRTINMVNDMRTLAHKVTWRGGNGKDGLPKQISQTYRSLRHWAKSNGFFGPGLGYFDSMTLFWLAYNAYINDNDAKSNENAVKEDEEERPTHLTLTTKAFHKLKSLFSGAVDTKHLSSFVIDVRGATGQLTTEHITAEATYNIHYALTNTPLDELLKENDVSLRDGDDDPTTALARHRENFLTGFRCYYVVEGESWAQSARDLEALSAKMRQAVLEKMAYLTSSEGMAIHGNEYPRLWPDALSEKGQKGWIVYAIGLRFGSNDPLLESATTHPDISAAITVRTETSEELLRRLRPAANSRGAVASPATTSAAAAAATTTLPPGPAIWAAGAALPPRPFRTASSAISRLRHDPAHAGIIYDVGYEDRFAGLVTVPLEDWGARATEEEDWVPEHRVRVLTRRWDGFVVWEREGRVDRTGDIPSAFERAWSERVVI